MKEATKLATMLGGGSICSVGSVFSHDGKYLITAGPSAVYAYSARTSQRVAVLYESASVLGVDSKRKSAVCIGTRDGWFKLWDVSAERVTHELHMGSPIQDLAIPMNSRIAFISMAHAQRGDGIVVKVDLDSWKLIRQWEYKEPEPMSVACDATGDCLACSSLNSHWVHIVGHTESKNKRKVLHLEATGALKLPVMCVAVDGGGRFVAAGLANGMIALFHNVNRTLASKKKEYTMKPTILHWHSNGVTSLDFSPDSYYLASSGMEGVLVLWDLGTLKPMFVPRLGGEIIHVSHNPAEPTVFVVALKQNMVKMVNTASYKILGAVCGVITPPRDVEPEEATGGCELHPQTGWVTFTGDNGILQFYDPLRNKHIGHLETLPRAKTSLYEYKRSKQKQRPSEPRVQAMVFNADGAVLVTVGVRPRGGVNNGLLTSLKFWDRDPSTHKPYETNTVVEEPHRDGVACLAYSQANDLAVTTSSSGEFKVWAKQTKNKVISWRCRSIGSYREEPMGGAAFSSDGSVLAVASITCITLWDPITSTRLGLLPFPESIRMHTAIQHLEFVSDTPYLVGCCPRAQILAVWDLLTMELQWAIPLCADQLTTDAVSQMFAVVIDTSQPAISDGKQNSGVIAVFSPEDSTPQVLYAQPRGAACCLRFTAPDTPMFAAGRAKENGKKSPHAPLLVILESRQFTIETGTGSLQTLVQEDDSPRSTLNGVPSPLELAFGPSVSQADDEEDDGKEERGASENNSKSYFLDIKKIPSHKVPPLGIMTSDLLDRLISKKRKERAVGEENSRAGRQRKRLRHNV